MRISSINVVQPSNVNYSLKARKVQPKMQQVPSEPSFKGWKAGAWGIVGTIVGGSAAALLSGGALLPVLLAASAGTTGGCIYGSSKEDNHDDDPINFDPCYPNYRDY